MYRISYDSNQTFFEVDVPISKSIANRLLVLSHLTGAKLEFNSRLPDDVLILQGALAKILASANKNTPQTINAQDAGTAFRFLTAVQAFTPGQWILTGTGRMNERPIYPLVDCLRSGGAHITYLEKEGFPPLDINGHPAPTSLNLNVDGSISSQYVSALCLLAPLFENGLKISIPDGGVSMSYIYMTLSLMRKIGFEIYSETENDNLVLTITRPTSSGEVEFEAFLESDWSSAAFFYSMASICEEKSLLLQGLKQSGTQGDERLIEIYEQLGVLSTSNSGGILLKPTKGLSTPLHIDFTDIPDLMPAVVLTCAMQGKSLICSGIDHLKFKESDRIATVNYNLKQLGYELIPKQNQYHLEKTGSAMPIKYFKSFDDHRIVMAFAMCAIREPILIDSISCTSKSFPDFWKQMKNLGFSIENHNEL